MSNIVNVNIQELADPGNIRVFEDIVIYLAAFAKLSIIYRYIIAEAIAIFIEREIQ